MTCHGFRSKAKEKQKEEKLPKRNEHIRSGTKEDAERVGWRGQCDERRVELQRTEARKRDVIGIFSEEARGAITIVIKKAMVGCDS